MGQRKEDVAEIPDKEARVFHNFEAVAREYDRMNDLISMGQHRRWKQDVVKALSSHNELGILDICCGTGDLTRLLAERNPTVKITGLDFSPSMLQVAENNRRTEHVNNIEFIQGNALALPFPDSSFSHTVNSFGLRNLKDYEQAVKEMRRVTAPGGLVVCLETSYPESWFLKPFFKVYFKYLMPGLAAILHRHYEEYAWLNLSTELFLSKRELAALFRKVGLHEVSYRAYMLGSCACHIGRK